MARASGSTTRGRRAASAEARDLTGSTPVPLDDVMGNDDPFPGTDLGRPVEVGGHLARRRLLGRRTGAGRRADGYWAVTPLQIGDAAVLVVRGWARRARAPTCSSRLGRGGRSPAGCSPPRARWSPTTTRPTTSSPRSGSPTRCSASTSTSTPPTSWPTPAPGWSRARRARVAAGAGSLHRASATCSTPSSGGSSGPSRPSSGGAGGATHQLTWHPTCPTERRIG